MHPVIRSLVGAFASVLAIIPHAHASLLGATGDFSESLDTAYYKNTGPLVLQALGRAIDGTTELTSANTVSNPTRYQGDLEATLGGLTLRLAPDLFNDYQTITFTVANIVGAPAITGFDLTGTGAIDMGASAPFTRTLSFTANSLTVSYAVNNPNAGDEFYLDPNGADTFAIRTAAEAAPSAVPEPAPLGLLAVGVTGTAFGLRRRKRA